MLPIQYAAYALMGKHKTGLPGSRREPHFIGREGYQTIAAGAQLALDPQLYQNDDSRFFFITHLVIAATGTNSMPFLAIRIRPTDNEPWSRDFVGLAALTPGRVFTAYSPPIVLPEPYPLAPGASLEITIKDTQVASDVSNATSQIVVGLIGYYETLPAYVRARKRPYWLYSSTTFKNPLPLTNKQNGQFSRGDLNPGFPFYADYMVINGYALSWAQIDQSLLYARLNITGRPRVLETRVPYAALLDMPSVGGAIPLYCTKLDGTNEFIVDIENQTGATIQYAECSVIGYRT